jgi:hypothetical protein
MKRVYLDSNVLIAYHSPDKAEDSKKKMLEDAWTVFAQLKDIQLCTSMWAVTEMVNILVSRKNMDRGTVAEIESQLVSEKRLRDLKIQIIEVSPQKDYDFCRVLLSCEAGHSEIPFRSWRCNSHRHHEEQWHRRHFDFR